MQYARITSYPLTVAAVSFLAQLAVQLAEFSRRVLLLTQLVRELLDH